MWQYTHTDELYHYGVLGMKWGRRKARYVTRDSKRTKNIRKKHIDEMTNKELKEANNRLQLERQYKDLTQKKNVGQKAVKAFIGVAGTIVAIEGAAKTYERIGKLAVKKIGKNAVPK